MLLQVLLGTPSTLFQGVAHNPDLGSGSNTQTWIVSSVAPAGSAGDVESPVVVAVGLCLVPEDPHGHMPVPGNYLLDGYCIHPLDLPC